MQHTIMVRLPAHPESAYPIFLDRQLLAKPRLWLPKALHHHRIIIITDHTVKKHYGTDLLSTLKKHATNTLLLSFPAGEASKTGQTKARIEEQLLKHHCGRNTLILALGGGVVGDLAGFVAATYMRGIPYIQIPTTLLAMVDSSVGGKTGIDTLYGKNLIGAFWQPQAVVADLTCLKSLPKKQLHNGLFEIIKIFLTHDAESFSILQKNQDAILAGNITVLKPLIQRAVILKATVVQQDETECHYRMVLNFGHTIGHALEQAADYKIPHGFCVGFGMLVEAKIAQLLNILPTTAYETIAAVLATLGISKKKFAMFDVNKILALTRLDKKTRNNKTLYVLLSGIGAVYESQQTIAHPVADQLVKQAFLSID